MARNPPVLKFPQPDQMVDSLFQGFDVPVKHRRVGANSLLVHDTCNIQPPLPGNLVPRNQRPRPLCKDFGATARTASESGFAKGVDHHSSGLRVIFAKKSVSTIVNALVNLRKRFAILKQIV
jgi:hypothetical protein